MLKITDLVVSLGKRYSENVVIRGLNISIDKKQTVGIAGSKESGKTTLVAAIAGLEKINSGKIEIKSSNKVVVLSNTLVKKVNFRKKIKMYIKNIYFCSDFLKAEELNPDILIVDDLENFHPNYISFIRNDTGNRLTFLLSKDQKLLSSITDDIKILDNGRFLPNY